MPNTMTIHQARTTQPIDDAIGDVLNDPQCAHFDYDQFTCESRDGMIIAILVMFVPITGEIVEMIWMEN